MGASSVSWVYAIAAAFTNKAEKELFLGTRDGRGRAIAMGSVISVLAA